MTLANGDIMVGEMQNGRWDGKSTYYSVYGSIRNRQFSNGEFESQSDDVTAYEAWFGTGNSFNKK